MSSKEFFRLFDDTSVIVVSWDISGSKTEPFTLCAGVGNDVAVEVIDVFMLIPWSVTLGENWEGLWGVRGLKDMVAAIEIKWRDEFLDAGDGRRKR